MSSDSASVLQQALALPDHDREMIAAELLASLSDDDIATSPSEATAWVSEINRRIDRLANGQSVGVDVATARAQVQAALKDQ